MTRSQRGSGALLQGALREGRGRGRSRDQVRIWSDMLT